MGSAWRIVLERRAADAFSGEGARLFGGRWNSPGTPLIYTSEHQATALLEILAHAEALVLREKFAAFFIEWDDRLVEHLPAKDLPKNWRVYPPRLATQRLGDAWARQARSAILAVPSVILPNETNFLLNPRHPDYGQIQIRPCESLLIDPRLH